MSLTDLAFIVHLHKISFLPIVAQIRRQTMFSMLDLSTINTFYMQEEKMWTYFHKDCKNLDSNMHKNGADVCANEGL